ncbi:MAG: DegV family protein [Firmicutes bacterium]|nr:DegV family protein [Bacillota bacterium]
MAERIRIVTDSTADLPVEVRRTHQIEVVPLNVHFGEEVLKDGEEIWAEEFYHRLKTEGTLANTSQPSPSEFVKVYERLAGEADHIFSIHISEKMSGTVSSAQLAVEMVRDKIGVTGVDSQLGSMALGFTVIAAARAALAGGHRGEVLAAIERVRQNLEVFFTVETMAYLNRTGRIGKATAFLGSLLNIRPILSLAEGLIVPVERFRGSAAKANVRLLELLSEAIGDQPCSVALVHADVPEEAERLKSLLPRYVRVEELFYSPIGPIVGAHAGPGTIGVMAVPRL